MQSPEVIERFKKSNSQNQNYLQRTWQKYKKKSWWAIGTTLILIPKGGLFWAGLVGAGTYVSTQINNYTSNHPYHLEAKVIEASIDEDYHGTIKVGFQNENKKNKTKNLHLIPQNEDKKEFPYKINKEEITNTFHSIQPGDSVSINAYDGLFRDYAVNIEKK